MSRTASGSQGMALYTGSTTLMRCTLLPTPAPAPPPRPRSWRSFAIASKAAYPSRRCAKYPAPVPGEVARPITPAGSGSGGTRCSLPKCGTAPSCHMACSNASNMRAPPSGPHKYPPPLASPKRAE
eukprot:815793-Prorocentrum_minimum.AAC.3